MELLIAGYGRQNSVRLMDVKDDFSVASQLWADDAINPSWISICGNYLFTCSESKAQGAVSMYERTKNGYTLLDSVETGNSGVSHIIYLPGKKLLIGSCYGNGTVFAIEVRERGFGPIKSKLILAEGEGHPVTRAHFSIADKAEQYLYVMNIALDRVYVFNISADGLQAREDFPYLQLPLGEGPRHAIFSPCGNYLYIITEYSSKVISTRVIDGKLEAIGECSTLSAGFTGENTGSGICASKDGKYLYGGNRGAETVAVLRNNGDGHLELIQEHTCYGKCPRHVALSNDGKCIIIGNQVNGEIVLMSVDPVSGLLGEKLITMPQGQASCAWETGEAK